VTTPRSDVQYIVTEWGVADLKLKSVQDRIREMLKIAHPDFRDQLKHEAEQAGLLF
jgi:4-hydroxybutyrate CoA-transferase